MNNLSIISLKVNFSLRNDQMQKKNRTFDGVQKGFFIII